LDPLVFAGLELRLTRNAVAGRREHVANVKVDLAVAVVVRPTHRHSRAIIDHTRVVGDVDETSPVIAIKAVLTVVICHIEIGIAVVVVVLPCRGQTVTPILRVQSGLLGHVSKLPAAALCRADVVAEQQIRTTIVSIVIDEVDAWLIVTGGSEFKVDAEVEVQVSILIIVGG